LHLFALAARWLAARRCSLLPKLHKPSLLGDSFLGVITPYRIDIVQGNVVTQGAAAAVKPGMTRAQVRDMLGSPLLTDPFHADRWDYVFTIRRQGTEPQRRSVVAHFEGRPAEGRGRARPAGRDAISSLRSAADQDGARTAARL
jgi:outer membrane protein assembly factor BamE